MLLYFGFAGWTRLSIQFFFLCVFACFRPSSLFSQGGLGGPVLSHWQPKMSQCKTVTAVVPRVFFGAYNYYCYSYFIVLSQYDKMRMQMHHGTFKMNYEGFQVCCWPLSASSSKDWGDQDSFCPSSSTQSVINSIQVHLFFHSCCSFFGHRCLFWTKLKMFGTSI